MPEMQSDAPLAEEGLAIEGDRGDSLLVEIDLQATIADRGRTHAQIRRRGVRRRWIVADKHPGRATGNWSWRAPAGVFDDALAARVRDLVEGSGRAGRTG